MAATGIPHDARAPDGPPGNRSLLGESRVVLEPARLLARVPGLLRGPRGDGRVVLDVPGWLAGETSMAPLRRYLRHLGHDARPWGLGRNLGDPERDRDRLLEVAAEAAAQTGRTVALVGWSLGGVVSREAARLRPDLVHRVVTYGTPVVGGPRHTVAAGHWDPQDTARIARRTAELHRTRPVRVPITAIYTRRDGVVDWRACIDRHSPDVTHVEVRSTHLGLGVDPDVWRVVADTLAA